MVGAHRAGARVDDGLHLALQAFADLLRLVQRLALAGLDQRGGEQRLAEGGEQLLRHTVVGHAQADGAARRMRDAARHLLGRLEDEGERPRRAELHQPVLAVVDARIAGQLAQVAAQQREVVLVVDAADAPQVLDRGLVVEMADERVARIGRDRGDAAGVQDLRRLLQQADLRVLGMDFEVLRHGPDCPCPAARALQSPMVSALTVEAGTGTRADSRAFSHTAAAPQAAITAMPAKAQASGTW